MITKNQAKVMEIFTGHITEEFSMREIALLIKKDTSLTRRAILPLIKDGYLNKTKKRNLILNNKHNQQTLAYVENLRSKEFLEKPKNKSISRFTNDVMQKIKEDSFVLIIFGSAVEKGNPRDIDVLLIIKDLKDVEINEGILSRIAENYPSIKFDYHVISFESVYEMLAKRDQKNVMNEILNKHLIIHGADLFYRLLEKGRM